MWRGGIQQTLTKDKFVWHTECKPDAYFKSQDCKQIRHRY